MTQLTLLDEPVRNREDEKLLDECYQQLDEAGAAEWALELDIEQQREANHAAALDRELAAEELAEIENGAPRGAVLTSPRGGEEVVGKQ